jgi:hypothetical protein
MNLIDDNDEIDEYISTIMIIFHLNDGETAKKLIKSQFHIVGKEDIEILDVKTVFKEFNDEVGSKHKFDELPSKWLKSNKFKLIKSKL